MLDDNMGTQAGLCIWPQARACDTLELPSRCIPPTQGLPVYLVS